MRTWGPRSQEVYDELDPRLRRVMLRVRDEVADISLIDGFRDEATQNEYFDTDRSRVRWPDGKHNKQPSLAVDFQPYPLPGKEVLQYAALGYIAGAALQIAKEEGVTLRWGGDWNSNGNVSDQKFFDLWHIEIVENQNETTDYTSMPRVTEPRHLS